MHGTKRFDNNVDFVIFIVVLARGAVGSCDGKKRGLRAPEFSHLVKDPVKSNWNIVTFSLNSLTLKFNKIIF